VIPHFNLGRYLPSTLVSILEQTYSNIEIILIDDCSTDENSKALIEDLRSKARPSMKVIAPPANLGLSAARNLAVAHANGEFIIPLDADDLVDRRFIDVAVRALQRNPDFDVVVSPAGYFTDAEPVVLPGENADLVDYAIFVGEALVSGFHENRFSTATAVFRGDVLRTYHYNESLRAYEDWNLYMRLAQDGRRFLVTTDVHFFYRNRPNSMVKEAHNRNRHALLVHDNLRTSVKVGRLTPLAYLAFCPAARHEPERSTAAIAPLQDSPLYLNTINLLAASMSKQLGRKRGPWLNAWPHSVVISWLRRSDSLENEVRTTLASSDLFDHDWYLDTYLDVRSARIDPVVHYIRHGAAEGRNPGPFFSTRDYLAANPDVATAHINPLFHYIRHGFKEKRPLHPHFR
jgi:glycosyltransferase involved in cell wall biosynthesis